MSTKVLTILGLATLIAVLLAFVLVDRSEDSSTVAGDELLLPDLAHQVNDIDAVEIVGPDGETVASLRRARERWRMRKKHDYEADFARIHDLLRDLSKARRLEAKTENPDWYGRLGVASPGAGNGSGVAVRFPGSELQALIVGKQDPAGIGRYVRVEDEAQAWLTSLDLELPVERMAWLERAIMDIPAEDIREVTVRHSDGDRVELRPGEREGSIWVMLDPPAEREVKEAWQLRQTANALARMNMEDVRPHDSHRVPADAVETVFRTRDGMVFTTTSFSDEDGNWVHFRVSRDESGEAAESEQDPATDQAGVSGPGDTGQSAENVAATDEEIDIVAVDGRLSPWQFAVSSDRFERLRPTTESLLVAKDASGD